MCFLRLVGVRTARAESDDNNCPFCFEPDLQLDQIVQNKRLRMWITRLDGEMSYTSQRAMLLKHIENLPQHPPAVTPGQAIPSLAGRRYRDPAAEPYRKRPRY